MTGSGTFALTQIRIVAGLWEGVLTGAEGPAPVIEALHHGTALGGVEVVPVPGQAGSYAVRVPIPAEILSEGVQTVILTLGMAVLGHFTIIAGVPLEEDLRAEIGLLRAELDLLKRAFQRQSREAKG